MKSLAHLSTAQVRRMMNSVFREERELAREELLIRREDRERTMTDDYSRRVPLGDSEGNNPGFVPL